ncbi:cupredoxin domain-containing protein [Glaciimonas sp. Gout2]|uniref:cupredoxin domain-containing protein n=1 Tax=unclassified Glaciimonas TaxID=2644401 RepID=UPI002AB468C4|nr:MULTISPECIES: cupredoxin domain-containing protein [unclassified Glaciimonas]MDY7547959.1 cupredoxin domain-containing protein [Glaciimonas sp. CA11.2]MEB0010131.1 cupredoxin domain-containing protein [Glaciimonas sp. Cout2]MEB0081754.1 cupredoxin domain-containing protein [Glaciimonas sp. Gout2]
MFVQNLRGVLAIGLLCTAGFSSAVDLPTFRLEMKDGVLNPARIEVPAGQKIKIEVHNTGSSAVEFESVQLRKEKVLGPGAQSFIVIAPLSPGEYKFFDDFHLSAKGLIVAK